MQYKSEVIFGEKDTFPLPLIVVKVPSATCTFFFLLEQDIYDKKKLGSLVIWSLALESMIQELELDTTMVVRALWSVPDCTKAQELEV